MSKQGPITDTDEQIPVVVVDAVDKVNTILEEETLEVTLDPNFVNNNTHKEEELDDGVFQIYGLFDSEKSKTSTEIDRELSAEMEALKLQKPQEFSEVPVNPQGWGSFIHQKLTNRPTEDGKIRELTLEQNKKNKERYEYKLKEWAKKVGELDESIKSQHLTTYNERQTKEQIFEDSKSSRQKEITNQINNPKFGFPALLLMAEQKKHAYLDQKNNDIRKVLNTKPTNAQNNQLEMETRKRIEARASKTPKLKI